MDDATLYTGKLFLFSNNSRARVYRFPMLLSSDLLAVTMRPGVR